MGEVCGRDCREYPSQPVLLIIQTPPWQYRNEVGWCAYDVTVISLQCEVQVEKRPHVHIFSCWGVLSLEIEYL